MHHSQPTITLAIYNQGSALVKVRRLITLQAGTNSVDFSDVPAGIDVASVRVASLSDPSGTTVLEQSYLFDFIDLSGLYKRYLGQRIEVTLEDGTHSAGQLLSAAPHSGPFRGGSGSLVIQQTDGQLVTFNPDKVQAVRFPALPEGLFLRPTLRWLIDSTRAGEQQIEVTYLTDGLNWTANYNARLSRDNQLLDLSGWVTLTNTSDMIFTHAQIKLIAGEVQREEPGMLGRRMEKFALAASGPVEERDLFEYTLYEIQRPVTLANNETKQVEFITRRAVPTHIFYVYDASPDNEWGRQPNVERNAGQTHKQPVQTWLELSTGEENGIGADLPAGRLRVLQDDIDGTTLLIGEHAIEHTPKGETIRTLLGSAFHLIAERKQTAFERDRTDQMDETFSIQLRNRKPDQTVEIRVVERLFRWVNWEITEASHPYTGVDSRTIEFRVIIPSGGKVELGYTVRYRWPVQD